MATIDLSNLKYSKISLSLAMDRVAVKVNALTNSIYSTGASKWMIKCSVVATTPEDREYLQGLVTGSLYYNNDFLLTLPPELIKTSDDTVLGMTEILSGANTLTNHRFNRKKQGQYFNIVSTQPKTKDKLYCIESVGQPNTLDMTVYPRISELITATERINLNFNAPKVRCLLTNKNATLKTIIGNDYYRELPLTFESV